MEYLVEAIKAHASRLDSQVGSVRFGVVTSVDAKLAMAKVTLQPEGILSGWLPVLSPWVGSGWGMVCLPSPGDQVLIVPQEGASEHGVIVGAAYSAIQRAPAAEVGELWFVHKSGSSIKLLNNGTTQIIGDLHVTGDVFDRHGSIAHLRDAFNRHYHRDSRQGITTPPTEIE